MHAYRRTKKKRGSERKHFPAILSFVYRNRFAVANQIQRRFADVLKSDRTVRRHLEEMETLGYLGVAPTRSTSPLWPKVYYVTKRGARRLREILARKGKAGNVIRLERTRPEGYSADHVLHEIFITEFLLAVWQTMRAREDLTLLATERRSLGKHPAFRVTVGSKVTQLEPDAMFLYRQEGKGMMCCFLEMDMGTMSAVQLRRKVERYENWAESRAAEQFLEALYSKYGARNPRAAFRLLVVASGKNNNDDRLAEVMEIGIAFPMTLRRCWFTTVTRLREQQFGSSPLDGPLWRTFRCATATALW
ncbi:MAG: replication-relaxation family protein [Pirellulales bacterium]